MASAPTRTQQHGKRNLEPVVALLPIRRHNTQQHPPTELEFRG